MSDETTTEQLAEIDRDMADIERQVAELVEEAQRADYPQPEPETTSEQLAEIEGQAESTPATEYTPPEGWRVLPVGEVLRNGDMWVWPTDDQLRQTVHVGAVVGANQRYIRRIEPQPQTEPDKTQELPTKTQEPEDKTQELPAQYTPPEGWRVLAVGEVLRDGDVTVRKDGYCYSTERVGGWVGANQRYIRPIEPEPQQVNDWPSVRQLRDELKTLQTQLGESRQRVTQLEELVASLRTINEGAEKAVSGAGVVNDSLRLQLAAVKAELAQERLERNRWHNQVLRVTAALDEKTTHCEILQIELDAAQQVPQAIADRFEEGWNQGTARAVETVLEWLQPIRAVDNEHLANETLQHLPQIMRHLTGLAQD